MESSEQKKYAGFWARTIALVVDGAILFSVAIVWGIIAAAFGDFGFGLFYAGLVPLSFAYFWWFWSKRGATPGLWTVSSQIISAKNGGKLSNDQLAMRFFGGWICVLSCGLGFLWCAFDKNRRCWHDHMSFSAVVCTTGESQ